MSTWRRTSKVRPRQRSSQCQRLRRPTRSCCSEKICARIEEILKISQNQRSSDLQSNETVFNKFLVKFSQCRPRLQTVKSRLKESCDLLSEIDELLDFFCDPQRLLAYILEEQPPAHLAATNSSPDQRIEPAGNKSAPQRPDKPKSVGRESSFLKSPGIETIAEEKEVSPPPTTGPVETTLRNGVNGSALLRESDSLLNGSQKRSLQMHSPDAPFYSPLEGERNERPASFNTSNGSAKRFKTSTPAGNGHPVSPPRVSLISQIHYNRRRRKAMIIDPPEENGAWMGTPVIRNNPDTQSAQTNGLEKRRSISIITAENEKKISAASAEGRQDQEACTLPPLTIEAVGKDAVASEEGKVDIRKADAQQERVALKKKPEEPKLVKEIVTRGRTGPRGPLSGETTMKTETQKPGKSDRKNGGGIVDAAPPPGASEDLLPLKRSSRRRVVKNACYTDSTSQKKT